MNSTGFQKAFVAITFACLVFLLAFAHRLVDLREIVVSVVYTIAVEPTQTSTTVEPDPCEERWPTMQLFLPAPTAGPDFNEMGFVFLQSLALFWPFERSRTRLLIVTDGENEEAAQRATERIKILGDKYNISQFIDVKLSFLGEKLRFQRLGHDRQQWLMFWAENFTEPETEYVAFVDTDSYFVSPVMLSDLFDDDRPIVRPLYGKTPNWKWFWQWPHQTEISVGRKEPFACMTYFPVIVKVSDLAPMREHIRRQMNFTTFNKAFEQLAKISYAVEYSQFSMMCAYMWYYRQGNYSWQVAQLHPEYKGPVLRGQVRNLSEAGIPPRLLRQTPRIASHKFAEMPRLKAGLRSGICYAFPNNDTDAPRFCDEIVADRFSQVNEYEWIFEGENYARTYPGALKSHQERLKLLYRCPENLAWKVNAKAYINYVAV